MTKTLDFDGFMVLVDDVIDTLMGVTSADLTDIDYYGAWLNGDGATRTAKRAIVASGFSAALA